MAKFEYMQRAFSSELKPSVSAGSAQPIWVGKKHPI